MQRIVMTQRRAICIFSSVAAVTKPVLHVVLVNLVGLGLIRLGRDSGLRHVQATLVLQFGWELGLQLSPVLF